MRTTLALTLALSLTLTLAHGQNYYPLLDSSMWYIHYQGMGGPNDNRSYLLVAEKDTFISPFTYKICIDSSGHVPSQILVREDIAARKVYKWANNADRLLFDFSLQLGDSIALRSSKKYGVYSIDTVNVSFGGKRRMWTLTRHANGFLQYMERWIEGVGSLMHPLMHNSEMSDPSFGLHCSYQNWEVIYNGGVWNDTTVYCPAFTPTKTPEPPVTPNSRVFPNPFIQTAVLRLNQNTTNASLTLTDIFGQEIRQFKNISGTEIKLEREGLPAGIYFIRLEQDDKIIATEKLLISN